MAPCDRFHVALALKSWGNTRTALAAADWHPVACQWLSRVPAGSTDSGSVWGRGLATVPCVWRLVTAGTSHVSSSYILAPAHRLAANRPQTALCGAYGTANRVSRATPNTATPVPDPRQQAIRDSRLPLLRRSKATGIVRASLLRFARGDTSLRLDVPDKLAACFGLKLRPEETTIRKAK